jgi:hypothetical protein
MPGFELFGDAKRKVVKDGLAYLTDKPLTNLIII